MKRTRFVADLILIAGFAACLVAAVRAIAALPETLHDAGLVVPVVWQDVVARSWNSPTTP